VGLLRSPPLSVMPVTKTLEFMGSKVIRQRFIWGIGARSLGMLLAHLNDLNWRLIRFAETAIVDFRKDFYRQAKVTV